MAGANGTARTISHLVGMGSELRQGSHWDSGRGLSRSGTEARLSSPLRPTEYIHHLVDIGPTTNNHPMPNTTSSVRTLAIRSTSPRPCRRATVTID